ncbi:hypothetical protein VTN02DRAFT_3702 [Thermoascus thermophilus]
MAAPTILLPGDDVPSDALPSTTSAPLRLGPGLRLLSSSSRSKGSPAPGYTVTASHAGLLSTDARRNAVSVLSFPNHRYIPTPHDLVIAQIHHSSQDYFHCVVTPHTPHALLGQLAFEGATKKTRPMLKTGDVVYARVLSAGSEVELTCVNPATGKAEPGGLGPLTGGMVFDVSPGLAARLLRGGSSADVVVLEELGKKLEAHGGFEIAVGRNGKVWVDCSGSGAVALQATVAIGRCLSEMDGRQLTPTEQRKLVSRILREMNIETNV